MYSTRTMVTNDGNHYGNYGNNMIGVNEKWTNRNSHYGDYQQRYTNVVI